MLGRELGRSTTGQRVERSVDLKHFGLRARVEDKRGVS